MKKSVQKGFSAAGLLLLLVSGNIFAQNNYSFWHNNGTAAATFSVNDNAVLDVTGDFTIEAWVKAPATASEGGTFYIAERAGVFRLYLLLSSGNLVARFDLVSGGPTISSGALTLGAWNHVAVSRSGSTTKIFVNGVGGGTADLALVASANICYIGGASTYFAAKKTIMDEVRFSNTARYTSDFSVNPAAGYLGSDANTIFYFPFTENTGVPPQDHGPNALATTNGKSGASLMSTSNYALDNSLLPVELTSFTASLHGSSVLLSWKTATETNNHGFDVERQTANGNWTKIGFVEGAGTSASPKSYQFVDAKAEGKVSYRLKQIDRDGGFSYSSVVEVMASMAPAGYELTQNYPNPFNPSTMIRFALKQSEHASLKVYDVAGREVAELFNDMAEAGKYYELPFNAAHLSSGMYIYVLQTPSHRDVKKMQLLK